MSELNRVLAADSRAPWTVLNIGADATMEAVKRAAKLLKLRVHPDKNGQTDAAFKAFIAVSTAEEAMLNFLEKLGAAGASPVHTPAASPASSPPRPVSAAKFAKATEVAMTTPKRPAVAAYAASAVKNKQYEAALRTMSPSSARFLLPEADALPWDGSLINKTKAMTLFSLSDKDMAAITPREMLQNPVSPAYAPMKLYRVSDVVTTMLAKHGSWAGLRSALEKSEARATKRAENKRAKAEAAADGKPPKPKKIKAAKAGGQPKAKRARTLQF